MLVNRQTLSTGFARSLTGNICVALVALLEGCAARNFKDCVESRSIKSHFAETETKVKLDAEIEHQGGGITFERASRIADEFESTSDYCTVQELICRCASKFLSDDTVSQQDCMNNGAHCSQRRNEVPAEGTESARVDPSGTSGAPVRPPSSAGDPMESINGGMFQGTNGRIGPMKIEHFYMDRTEVTIFEYRKCVKAGVCREPRYELHKEWIQDKHPVANVSFRDAMAYCTWVGKRLPSAHEWTWAAQGRDEKRKYPWGDAPPTCARAVMLDGGAGCGTEWVLPVSSKSGGMSRDGLEDMAGNVSEWTSTMYDDRNLVLGGDFYQADMRISREDSYWPTEQKWTVGFRCAQ